MRFMLNQLRNVPALKPRYSAASDTESKPLESRRSPQGVLLLGFMGMSQGRTLSRQHTPVRCMRKRSETVCAVRTCVLSPRRSGDERRLCGSRASHRKDGRFRSNRPFQKRILACCTGESKVFVRKNDEIYRSGSVDFEQREPQSPMHAQPTSRVSERHRCGMRHCKGTGMRRRWLRLSAEPAPPKTRQVDCLAVDRFRGENDLDPQLNKRDNREHQGGKAPCNGHSDDPCDSAPT